MKSASRKTLIEVLLYTLVFFVLYMTLLFTIGDDNLYVFVPGMLACAAFATFIRNRIIAWLWKP